MVPARDEADVIGRAIGSLVAQDYPGSFRIVLVDDGSSDGTADVARAAGSERLTVISGSPPPRGLDRQALGDAERHRGGGHVAALSLVHRRRHRARAEHAPLARRTRRERRARDEFADGGAPLRERRREGLRPGVRLLLPDALSVRARESSELARRGRGRRLHARESCGARERRRSEGDQGRAHRRLRARCPHEERGARSGSRSRAALGAFVRTAAGARSVR